MKSTTLVAAAALAILPAVAFAQDTRPYTPGHVTQLSYLKIKPGRFDDYMRYLGGAYRRQMEAYQKAGLVVDYKVLSLTPRTPKEPDIILSVTYPNMAALDRNQEFDAIAQQVAGTFAEQNKGFADRGAMREVLGSELAREMILK